jgi:homogentisate phytyltransferase/homogentisate geranylgeranyltransferase
VTTLALRAASAPFAFLGVLWRFSRPHTLIGTTLSILGIAAITGTGGAGDLLLTLLAGATVNLFIVGVNQVEDVEIDRINKPHLPIAAGALSLTAAKWIVAACAVAPVLMGLTQGALETVAVLTAIAVGAAYSMPPLRLKRFPAVAAGSISLVRAVVVNLAVCLHFSDTVPPAVWALTLFVLPFSFAIAILKDVPDAEGDRAHRIFTFTLRLGPRRVLRIGMGALTLGYVGMAVLGPLLVDGADPVVLAAGHLAALAVLLAWARRAFDDFTAFYMRVWGLFFCEYLLVPGAVLLA